MLRKLNWKLFLRASVSIALLGWFAATVKWSDIGLAFAASIEFAFLVSACSLWGGWVWLSGRRKGENKGVGFESS